MTDWNSDMSAAPRDGTRILLVGDPDNPLTVVVGKQYQDIVTPGCWDTEYGDWWPTHWMPLPTPPEAKQ